MTIRSPTGKEKTIAGVRMNAGVSAAYERALVALIKAMSDDVDRTIRRHYERAEGQIAADQSPLSDLKASVSELSRKWQRRFADAAPDEAKRFVRATQAHNARTSRARFKAAGLTVEFKPTRQIRQVMSAAIAENTKLIKSIASEYLTDVEGIVNRGIMAGGDLGKITRELQRRYDVTHRRAAFIARQENRNATAAMNRARDIDLGLEEGIWRHSGGGKHPRPSHVQAGKERLRFKISEGALIDGEHILPGQPFNCKCYYLTVLPGYNN